MKSPTFQAPELQYFIFQMDSVLCYSLSHTLSLSADKERVILATAHW